MQLKKLKDIIKSIGTPNKDDTLLGVFGGKTAQKSIEDILKVTDREHCVPERLNLQRFQTADMKQSPKHPLHITVLKSLRLTKVIYCS